jgi:hypothetical protein
LTERNKYNRLSSWILSVIRDVTIIAVVLSLFMVVISVMVESSPLDALESLLPGKTETYVFANGESGSSTGCTDCDFPDEEEAKTAGSSLQYTAETASDNSTGKKFQIYLNRHIFSGKQPTCDMEVCPNYHVEVYSFTPKFNPHECEIWPELKGTFIPDIDGKCTLDIPPDKYTLLIRYEFLSFPAERMKIVCHVDTINEPSPKGILVGPHVWDSGIPIPNIVPAVSPATGQAGTTYTSPVIFNVYFNDTVTGFGDSTSDVSLEGTASPTGIEITSMGNDNYRVEISGMFTSGTLGIKIPAGVCKDKLVLLNIESASSAIIDYQVSKSESQ